MHHVVPLRDTNYPNLKGDAAIPMKNHVMMRCCHSFMYIMYNFITSILNWPEYFSLHELQRDITHTIITYKSDIVSCQFNDSQFLGGVKFLQVPAIRQQRSQNLVITVNNGPIF